MSTAKAAQIQSTLSSLTPVHDAIHSHANQYPHPHHHHHPHLHPGAHPGLHGGAGGQVPEHLIGANDQGGHNFSVDSLMTAQQQIQHQNNDNIGSSREGSPAHQATPPLNCASDEGVAYRAAAAAAAMASWTNNCSQNNYNQQHLEDHAPPHVQEGGVANDAHAHANYRTWYAVPPSAGSPVSQVDPYHHSTTPPSTNSTTPTSFNTPPTSRENYGSNSSAAAAAAAAAAVYRSSMFHYNQDCSSPGPHPPPPALVSSGSISGGLEPHKY